MTLESDAKFEENQTCGLENNMRNLAIFHQSTWKLGLKIETFMDTFIPSRKCMCLKFTEDPNKKNDRCLTDVNQCLTNIIQF